LFDTTQEVCARHDLAAYEISNHARPGGECRHNLVYWRYGEWAGVGPGAHGRLVVDGARRAQATEKSPEMWLASVAAEGHGLVEDEALSREAEGDEYLLMGLRLAEGIDPARYAALAGRELSPARIEELLGYGLVARRPGGRLATTREGAAVLDAVVADLAA
jgi:oxygen-independent coproporphyrinogen-3 oxidase